MYAGLDDLADADEPGGTPTIVVCSGELVEKVRIVLIARSSPITKFY